MIQFKGSEKKMSWSYLRFALLTWEAEPTNNQTAYRKLHTSCLMDLVNLTLLVHANGCFLILVTETSRAKQDFITKFIKVFKTGEPFHSEGL